MLQNIVVKKTEDARLASFLRPRASYSAGMFVDAPDGRVNQYGTSGDRRERFSCKTVSIFMLQEGQGTAPMFVPMFREIL